MGLMLYGVILVLPKTMPEQKVVIPAGYKQETLIDHTLFVPESVTKSQVGDETVFSHAFNAQYDSSCDFIGVGKQTLVDIEIGTRLVEGDIKQAIDATMNRPLAWKDFLAENSTALPETGTYKIIGGHNVYELPLSVEWCGQTYDFVVIKPTVTLVVRTPIRTLDFSETGKNYSALQTLTNNALTSEEKVRTQVATLITSFK